MTTPSERPFHEKFVEYIDGGVEKVIDEHSNPVKPGQTSGLLPIEVALVRAALAVGLGRIITTRPKSVLSRRQIYRDIIKDIHIGEVTDQTASLEQQEEAVRRYSSDDVVDELLMQLFKSPGDRAAKPRHRARKDDGVGYKQICDAMTILLDEEGGEGRQAVLMLLSRGVNQIIEARPACISQAEAYRSIISNFYDTGLRRAGSKPADGPAAEDAIDALLIDIFNARSPLFEKSRQAT